MCAEAASSPSDIQLPGGAGSPRAPPTGALAGLVRRKARIQQSHDSDGPGWGAGENVGDGSRDVRKKTSK